MDFVTFFENLTPPVQIVFLLCILAIIVGSVVTLLVAACSRGATRNMTTLISTVMYYFRRPRALPGPPSDSIIKRSLPQTDMLE